VNTDHSETIENRMAEIRIENQTTLTDLVCIVVCVDLCSVYTSTGEKERSCNCTIQIKVRKLYIGFGREN